LRVYKLGDYEVSEDAAIFAEAWYEALEDKYGSFSEFLTDCVKKRTEPYLNDARGEKASRIREEKGWENIYSIGLSKEKYDVIKRLADEKGLTIDEYASDLLVATLEDNSII
jgi:hypothetical protein